jgi:hypothetical protein
MFGVARLSYNSGNLPVKYGNTTRQYSDHHIKSSGQIRDAQINNEIMKLNENIDSYDVSDRWYFELPLALHLREPLRTRCRWLLNAKILVRKSSNQAMSGQMTLSTYYEYLNAPHHVVKSSLGPPIQAA